MIAAALFVSAQGRLRSGWRVALFAVLLSVFAPVAQIITAIPGWVLPAGDATVIVASEVPLTWVALVVAALAAHLVMLAFVDRTGWAYVGLAGRAAGPRPVARGFALGGLAIGLPCALLLAIGWLALVRAPDTTPTVGRELAMVLAVLIPAALAEELLVRGYLLSALADGMGRTWSVIATSVAFAVMHARNPGMAPGALVVVALAGVFLGALRFATASLYAAWAAHLAWNLVLGVLLHALVSGTTVALAGWQTIDSGPDWATGGSWGPEGGVPAAAGLLVATWYLIRRRRSAPVVSPADTPGTAAIAQQDGVHA